MKRRLALALVCLVGLVAAAHAQTGPAFATLEFERPDATGASLVSELAPPSRHGAAEVPSDWLAQRSIDREWGPSDDSLYKVVNVPGWKSEGLALTLSGVLPGAGEHYVGEGSGWMFLAAEAAGWVGRAVTRKKSDDLRAQAAAFIGDPTDTSSTWSFDRYASQTGGLPSELVALWAGDREAYYQAIATNPIYRAGFKGSDPGITYESYKGLRDDSQDRRRQSHYYEVALWANHLLSAFDALRAARFHNLPLRKNLDLQLGARMRRGDPTLRAALMRRF